MRSAISPRLAIRIFLNIVAEVSDRLPAASNPAPFAAVSIRSFDDEQRLAELDRLAVLTQNFADDPGRVGLDLVHDFHGFDDADRLAPPCGGGVPPPQRK